MNSRSSMYILALPAILLVSILAVGLLLLLWKSFHSYDAFRGIQGSLSLDQYRRLISSMGLSSYYGRVMVRTLLMSGAITASSVLLAVPLAYFIVRLRSHLGRMISLVLILVPFLMGEIVRVFGWLILLGREGALAWIYHLAGATAPRVIGTNTGIWIGSLQVMLPIAALILLPSVRRIHPDLERAAQTLGAPPAMVWLHVIRPLVLPGMVAASIAVFSLSMTLYAVPDILGAGAKPFVANAIHNTFFFQNNLYLGSAFAMIMLAVIVLLVSVFLLTTGRILRRVDRS